MRELHQYFNYQRVGNLPYFFSLVALHREENQANLTPPSEIEKKGDREENFRGIKQHIRLSIACMDEIAMTKAS